MITSHPAASGPRPDPRAAHARARPQRPAPAFTLVEMLVVIVILGVLIAIVIAVAGHVVYNQKAALTRTIQQNLLTAIDEFAVLDPLRAVYNTASTETISNVRRRPTFGPYPPYPLFRRGDPGPRTVVGTLEPKELLPLSNGGRGQPTNELADRVHRDLFNYDANARVTIDPQDPRNDDNRALYVYLRRYVPDALARIPDRFLAKLTDDPVNQDIIDGNTRDGSGAARYDVLGILDAWGVPLDYLLYVKLEAVTDLRGASAWTIADRKPALRSLGVSRDVYDTYGRTIDLVPGGTNYDERIWSSDLPMPEAGGPYPGGVNDSARQRFWADGVLGAPDPARNGWARAVQAGKFAYGFLPDPKQDK